MNIPERMVQILKELTPVQAAKVVAAIHSDDRAKLNAFALEVGGWEAIATHFSDLLEGAERDGENGRMTPNMAATLLGVAAALRAQGYGPELIKK